MSLFARVEHSFARAFGGMPELLARAPGRVNLIGEHTDYNDGFVLPMAISGQSVIAARRRDDRLVRIVAVDFDESRDEFSLFDAPHRNGNAPWSDYVRAMVYAMARFGLDSAGADIAIAGDLPRGAGLSSSASLMVALGTACAGLFPHDEVTPERIALLAQRAECDFVGTRCGIMDQLVSARATAGHALLIDCRSLECRPVSLPTDIAVMIVHSGVERGLVEGAYNARRAQCEEAARLMGIPALRDASPEQLDASRALLDEETYRRARHVISENDRTLAAASALSAGNDLRLLGRLMAASHKSMRDDFEITVPAVDGLVSLLQQAIGDEGGARMTGGGFGGAVVALLPAARVASVRAQVETHYRTPTGAVPLILIERPCAGAEIVK